MYSINFKKLGFKTTESSRPSRGREFEALIQPSPKARPTDIECPLDVVSVACQLRLLACESQEPESTRSAQSLIALCTPHVAAVTIPRSIKKTSKIIRRRM